MGYRLEISRIIDSDLGGTKLYGYVEDVTKLKSWNWLVNNGHLNEENKLFFEWDGNPSIILSKDEFRDFTKLYWEDIKDFRNPEWNMPDTIKDLIEEDCSKLLEWW